MSRASVVIALAAALFSAHAAADAAHLVTHTLVLPRAMSTPAAIDGQPPSLAHPRGTVIMVATEDGQPAPTVAEWDLATGTRLQNLSLPIPPTAIVFEMLRAGTRIHIVGRGVRGPLWYIRLDAALQIEGVESFASGTEVNIATDGTLVAIAWCGPENAAMDSQTHILTADASGRHLGSAIIDKAPTMCGWESPVAVLDGKVFVLGGGNLKTPLVKLGADARIEASVVVDNPSRPSGSLWAVAGNVLLVDSNACRAWKVDATDLADQRWLGFPPVIVHGDCPGLGLKPDSTGLSASATGDLLSPDLKIVRHFADAGQKYTATHALWIAGAPALVATNYHTHATWLTWTEPPVRPH